MFDINKNYLIKGNNLLVLEKMINCFAGKVKLIYIDPPYNTKGSTLNYSDNANRATWLTFMKQRLELAKKLLRDDGFIFISINNLEYNYISIVLNYVFGENNFVGNMIRKTRSGEILSLTGFNTIHENLLIYSKTDKFEKLRGKNKYDSVSLKIENGKKYNPSGAVLSPFLLDEPTRRNNDNPTRRNNDNPTISKYVYEITNPYTGQVDLPPTGRSWRYTKEKFDELVKEGVIVFRKKIKSNTRGFVLFRFIDNCKNQFNMVRSTELAENQYMNQVGTKELINLNINFAFPKPESLIQYILNTSTKEGDLVLDFFAGSGTTLAVAHKMGRQYIGIEQMDYIEGITKLRLQKVIDGEQGGISKAVNWKGGGSFEFVDFNTCINNNYSI